MVDLQKIAGHFSGWNKQEIYRTFRRSHRHTFGRLKGKRPYRSDRLPAIRFTIQRSDRVSRVTGNLKEAVGKHLL